MITVTIDELVTARYRQAFFTRGRGLMRRQCQVDGCENFVHGNNLCFKHYMRLRRNGEVGPAQNMRADHISVCSDEKLRRAFWVQKDNARKRGISFELTFEQWLSIWRKSGKLQLRGIAGPESFVMARYGDVGSYSIDNVKIISNAENTRERHLGNSYNLGRRHTEEHRARRSAWMKKRWRELRREK